MLHLLFDNLVYLANDPEGNTDDGSVSRVMYATNIHH